MMVYCQEVWNEPITGTAAHYTTPELYETLAQAESFALFVRVSQGSGTTPSLTVVLEHSNDGMNWEDKATFLSSQNITTASVGTYWADDDGTSDVGGCFMRLRISLGGTNPSAHLQMTLTGRSHTL